MILTTFLLLIQAFSQQAHASIRRIRSKLCHSIWRIKFMNYEVPQILNMMLKSMFPGDLDNCIPSIVALDDYQKRIMTLDGVEKFTSIILVT